MSGHPDVESLAAYAAGDLTASEAHTVAEHLTGCAACASDVVALRRVAADLSELPPLAMPDDVAASLDAVLEAERAPAASDPEPAPVADLDRRRRRRLAPLLTGAAAASLVGAIAFTVVTRSTPGVNETAARDSGSGSAAGGPLRYYASGFAYDQGNVEAGALKLLAGDASTYAPQADAAPRAPAESVTASPTGFSSGDDQQDVRTTAGEILASSDQERFGRCLDLLREDKTVQPVAVDYAQFEGQAAWVVVLPFRDDQYDVFVVTRRCGETADATLLHFQRVRRA